MKLVGGVLSPADDMVQEKMEKFKSNEVYEVEIKRPRNPEFHSKMFVFFHFCFDYWVADNKYEFTNKNKQFEIFRKNLTALAGYHEEFYKINPDKPRLPLDVAEAINQMFEGNGTYNQRLEHEVKEYLLEKLRQSIPDTQVRIEAKSLSFGGMDQDEFEDCYHACIQAAMKHIFKPEDLHTEDNGQQTPIMEKLQSFF